jgi:hypothetical protein
MCPDYLAIATEPDSAQIFGAEILNYDSRL